MLIPEHDELIIEKAIYLPLLVKILNRDLAVIEQSQFKFKQPYINFVDKVNHSIQKELSETKKYMFDNKIKVVESGTEGSLLKYLIVYKGYERLDKYYIYTLRMRSERMLEDYLFGRKRKPSMWDIEESDPPM